MNPGRRLLIGAIVLVSAGAGYAAGRIQFRPVERVVQPIAFNHKIHVEDAGVAGQDRLQLGDLGAQLRQLVEHLLALERGEGAQPHVEDGLRLALGEPELAHQPVAGGGRVGRGADARDHAS